MSFCLSCDTRAEQRRYRRARRGVLRIKHFVCVNIVCVVCFIAAKVMARVPSRHSEQGAAHQALTWMKFPCEVGKRFNRPNQSWHPWRRLIRRCDCLLLHCRCYYCLCVVPNLIFIEFCCQERSKKKSNDHDISHARKKHKRSDGIDDDEEEEAKVNRRRSIKESRIANKWQSSKRSLYANFQAQAMSIYGAEFPTESGSRGVCARLLIDSARPFMTSSEFKEFRKDIRDGIMFIDGREVLRYVPKMRELCAKPRSHTPFA